MRRAPCFQPVVVIGILALAGYACAAAPWWDDDWSFRRRIAVGDYEPTGLEGEDVAVVTMPTGGQMTDDGRDIRVVTDGREVLPCRVLRVGPGDEVTVAFALRKGKDAYHVYFGNPKADWPEEVLEIRRGVLQESWKYPGGEFDTLAEAQAVLARVTEFYGADFRPMIFQGHNPFGPETNVTSLYTAYIDVPRTAEYTFCISSRNGAFLTIDGEELLANGGRHAPQQDVAIQATTELTKGLHCLKFYHVSPSGDPVVVLAWQPPEATRIWPMGAADFTRVTYATPLVIEERGKAASVDFIPDHAGEAYFRDRYIQRYVFRAMTSRDLGQGVEWQWEFGDGVVAQGEEVEHVYLAPGEYTVTLTALNRTDQPSRTQRIVVNRPWDQVTTTDMDSLEGYFRIVRGYDLTRLDASNLAGVIVLADQFGDGRMLAQAAEAYMAFDAVPADTALEAMALYTAHLIGEGQADLAAAKAGDLAGRIDQPHVAAGVYLLSARTQLDSMNSPADALGTLEVALEAISELPADDLSRELWRGVGDAHRLLGDYDAAQGAYANAEPAGARLPGREAFEEGDFARHVESYLDDRDFAAADDYLLRWARQLPQAPLEGYWSLWQVRRCLLAGDNAGAIAEADTLLAVNPGSSYGGEITMLKANAWYRMNDMEQYAQTLRELVEAYPESSYAQQAAQRLRGE